MASFDLFTIGHSNSPAGRFLAMLQAAGVTVLVDVRSVPHSRWFPWFSQKHLAGELAGAGIAYGAMGATLGGRPGDPALYRDGLVDYEAMAQTAQYRGGIARLVEAAAHSRVCVMCAEREPLDCHRCLLVARSLADRGLTVGHILHDGSIEPHAATEQRLLALHGAACDLFAAGQRELIAAAYRQRARAAAFRRKVPARRGAAAAAGKE
jgi:uncharacterized protein (DUF488 family)